MLLYNDSMQMRVDKLCSTCCLSPILSSTHTVSYLLLMTHAQCLAECNTVQVKVCVYVLKWRSLYCRVHMSFVRHAGLLSELGFNVG